MADDRGASRPGGTMRGDQGGRVQFKMTGRVGGDIGGRDDAFYPTGCAEQQAAHFMPIGGGQGHDLFQQ